MSEFETHEVIMSPGNASVAKLLAASAECYDEENPAQVITDMVMALMITVELLEAKAGALEELIETARPGAKVAAEMMRDMPEEDAE